MGTTIDKVLIVFLFLRVFQSLCFAQCNFYNPNFDLVLQPFGKDKLIVPEFTNELLKDGREITIFCPGGFENYDNRTKTLNVRCENGNLVSADEFGTEISRDLSCRRGPWKTSIDGSAKCSQDSFYVVGFQIQNSTVIFSKICFNDKNFKLDYVHYVAGTRSPLLSRHVETNPVLISGDLDYKFNPLLEPYFMTDDELTDNVGKIFESAPINFTYKTLVPSWIYEPYYKKSLDSNYIEKVIFWNQLRDGNWKKFEDDLKAQSEKHMYDVFIGTSDISPGPPSTGLYESKINLTFQPEHKFTQSVPKYIWAYLTQRGQTEADLQRFIVVAVNTPYFESVATNSDIFCEDMCDQIDWLKSLNPTRKMSAFGYTFCCEYSENVIQKLDGFPMRPLYRNEGVFMSVKTTTETTDDV